MKVHWCQLANTIELVLPLANPRPQPKQQMDRFIRFCTAHGRLSSAMPGHVLSPNSCPFANTCFLGLTWVHNWANNISIGSAVFAQITTECRYTLQWTSPSPLKLPLPMGDLEPPSNTWFPGPIRPHNPNGILIGSAIFCTDDCRVFLYTLQWDAPSPSKLPPPVGWSEPRSNTLFSGPSWVLNPNGILMGSAVFAGLTSVTDRPTDHATRSVTMCRIYIRSTAIQPNNNYSYVFSLVLGIEIVFLCSYRWSYSIWPVDLKFTCIHCTFT